MATAFVKVRRVGGSMVATVPKGIRESMNLHEGDMIKLEIMKPGVDFLVH